MVFRRHLAGFAAAVSLFAGAPVSAAPEIAHVATVCPTEGADSACVVLPLSGHPDRPDESYLEPAVTPHTVVVLARVNNGAAKRVELAVDQPRLSFNSADDLGPVAFLGRSIRNRPIVLTDRGDVEILTPSIEISNLPAILIIDERQLKVLSQYPAINSAVSYFSGRSVGVWDKSRGVCISAPVQQRRLRLTPDACGGDYEELSTHDEFWGDFDSDRHFIGNRLAGLKVGKVTGWGSGDSFRIRGTHRRVVEVVPVEME